MVWKGIAVSLLSLALFARAVLYAVHHTPQAARFSGLQFAALTPAAQPDAAVAARRHAGSTGDRRQSRRRPRSSLAWWWRQSMAFGHFSTPSLNMVRVTPPANIDAYAL
jgi:hypothetical protein